MNKILKLSMTDITELIRVAKKFDIKFNVLGAIFLSYLRNGHDELFQLNLETFCQPYGHFIRQELCSLTTLCKERYQSFDNVKSMYLTSHRLVIIYEEYCYETSNEAKLHLT